MILLIFHVLIFLSSVLFGEMSVRVSCPFLKVGLFVVLLLSFDGSLYILHVGPSSDR